MKIIGISGQAGTGKDTAAKFMVDTHKPTLEARDALRKENVYVGRPWPSMPTSIRVTVGTAEEMKKFQDAFVKSFA